MSSSRWRRHTTFLPITAAIYVVCVTAALSAAKSSFDASPWLTGFSDALGKLASPAYVLPFVGAEFLAVEVAHHDGHRKASLFLVGVSLAMLWLIYDGALTSLHALGQSRWTAAALSEGFVAIWSGAVLLVGVLLAGGTKWKYG